jgi:hypothetical protein
MATTTSSGVAIWNFTLKQGADWAPTWTWLDDNGNPTNLTNYSMQMDIKAFTSSPVVLLSLSSASQSGSRLVLGGTAGTVQMVFARADTAELQPTGLPLPSSSLTGSRTFALGTYDLQFTDPNGLVGYALQGQVFLETSDTP